MKNCTLCKEQKPLSEFNKHSKRADGLQTVCRECNRARSRRYYADNPDKHKEAVSLRNKKQRALYYEWITEYKESRPCADCGGYFAACAMDFDHLRDKQFNVSHMVGQSRTTILKEMEKCELVCANCHRVRTRDRRRVKPL